MTTTTMFTALRKNNLATTTLMLLIASAITCFAFFIKPNQSQKHSLLNSTALPTKNNVLIYIPNSYLSYLLKKVVLNSAQNIYDKNVYDFYEIAYSNTNGMQKTFTLSLIKKSTFTASTNTNEKSLQANIESYYSESNFLKKDINLSLANKDISIKTKDVNNNEIELYKAGYEDLLVKISDSK